MSLISLYNDAAAGQTLTSNASANTQGNKVVLSASTSATVEYIHVWFKVVSTSRDFLVAFYTGASGSEVEIARVGHRNTISNKFGSMRIRVRVPAGSRLTASCQDPTGSGQITIWVAGQVATSVVQTGATSATYLSGSSLVSVTGGNSAWGSAASIVASTAADYNCFSVFINEVNTAGASGLVRFKVNGTVVATTMYQLITNGDPTCQSIEFFYDVAAGSSIGAEAYSTSATGNNVRIGMTAMNVPALSGGGSTTIIQGRGMQRLLKDGETNAGRKTIALDIRTAAGAIYNANGETCRIKTGTGAWTNCTNTIVGTADGNEITLTDAEAAAGAPGDIIQVYAAASGSHLASPIAVYEVNSLDPSSTTLDVNVTSILGTTGSTTELTAVPAINASFWDMLKWMFSKSRNKVTQTASAQVVYKDDGSTTLGTSTTSDNGTTATRGEFA